VERRKNKSSPPSPQAVAEDRRLADAAYDLLADINGYAEIFSVFSGEPVQIRAARKVTAQTRESAEHPCANIVRIEIRNAATGKLAASRKMQGVPVFAQLPASSTDSGADYSARVDLETAGLPPALYECVLFDDADKCSQDIHFNVKPRLHDGYGLVCVLPTFTWQAYNRIGGGCFYDTDRQRRLTVSTQRPISRKTDNSSSGALPFLSLFSQAGIAFCCVDSWDLHHGLCPGGDAPVLALLTHDEYWTDEMRGTVDMFLERRGSLLVLAGNVCWWRMKVRGTHLIVNKDPATLRGQHWHERGVPDETTFASSYRFGGYALERARRKPAFKDFIAKLPPSAERDCAEMRVTAPEHPIFKGVTLGADDNFGGEIPIMYREVDGVPLDAAGAVDRKRYRADAVTPHILATGLAFGGPRREGTMRKIGVIVEAELRGGHVLHMGSFGWSRGLSQDNKMIRRIVLNAYEYCRNIARIAAMEKSGARIEEEMGAPVQRMASVRNLLRSIGLGR
jgi:hypothetical protein